MGKVVTRCLAWCQASIKGTDGHLSPLFTELELVSLLLLVLPGNAGADEMRRNSPFVYVNGGSLTIFSNLQLKCSVSCNWTLRRQTLVSVAPAIFAPKESHRFVQIPLPGLQTIPNIRDAHLWPESMVGIKGAIQLYHQCIFLKKHIFTKSQKCFLTIVVSGPFGVLCVTGCREDQNSEEGCKAQKRARGP